MCQGLAQPIYPLRPNSSPQFLEKGDQNESSTLNESTNMEAEYTNHIKWTNPVGEIAQEISDNSPDLDGRAQLVGPDVIKDGEQYVFFSSSLDYFDSCGAVNAWMETIAASRSRMDIKSVINLETQTLNPNSSPQ